MCQLRGCKEIKVAMIKPVKIPVILGPTACGKTDLSLSLAQEFGMEIISCDSRQIYRSMDIGTAKPTPLQRQSVRHWMIDIVDPDTIYSAYQFSQESVRIIRERSIEGVPLLICGGTGLYFQALSKGLGPAVSPDLHVRDQLQKMVDTQGKEALFAKLQQVDPVTSAQSHANNVARNIRAMEVFQITGQPMSLQKQFAMAPDGLEFVVFILQTDRDVLYDRINARVDAMIEQGLLQEFDRLKTAGYTQDSPGMRCVGYQEFFKVGDGPQSISKAINLIKQHSRNYAKRQITWFAHQCDGMRMKIDNNTVDMIRSEFKKMGFTGS